MPMKEPIIELKHITKRFAKVLANDDVYSLAKEGYDVFSIAQQLGTDVNLMLIKMQEMNKLGYDFRIDVEHDSRFFRKIKGSQI